MSVPQFTLNTTLAPAPVVMVVPPFASSTDPCLAAGLLKAAVEKVGVDCRVLHANLSLARALGEYYERVAGTDLEDQLGERFFARAAHSDKPAVTMDDDDGLAQPEVLEHSGLSNRTGRFEPHECQEIQAVCDVFPAYCAERILELEPRIVGFSSTLQQTNSSIAIAKEIKRRRPEVITCIGGNNCTGPMGEAMADAFPCFDFVFQGEGDTAFPKFCRAYLDEGRLPAERLVRCGLEGGMDALPIPNFDDYEGQRLVDAAEGWLFFESSRGCWWGDKHHCTFCGLMGPELKFRAKSPERLVSELMELRERYPKNHRFFAADLIVPLEFYKSAFDQLADQGFDRELYYEIKVNTSREQLRKMKNAGVVAVQPGIESLSTHSLKLMRKGTTAARNIQFLRDCRELSLVPTWNIIVRVPGDREQDYQEQLRLAAKIQHLNPPIGVGPIIVQRFSPYHFEADQHGVSGLKPTRGYRLAFPEHVDLERLAYSFESEYQSAGREKPELVEELRASVKRWIARWNSEEQPKLEVKRLAPGAYIVFDTRDCAISRVNLIGEDEYQTLRRLRVPRATEKAIEEPGMELLLEQGYVLEVDDRLISLVCDFDEESADTTFTRELHAMRREDSGAAVSAAHSDRS